MRKFSPRGFQGCRIQEVGTSDVTVSGESSQVYRNFQPNPTEYSRWSMPTNNSITELIDSFSFGNVKISGSLSARIQAS